MNKQDKILSLTKYVETLTNRLSNVPSRRLSQKEVYIAWIKREVEQANKKISFLKS